MYNWKTIIELCTLFACIAITSARSPVTMGLKNVAEPRTMDSICLTPACIHSASRILRSMNSSVKPCDDFYEFACGNFVKSATIPSDYNTVSPFQQARVEVESRLYQIIDDIEESTAPKHFRLLKTYYKNCMKQRWLRGFTRIESMNQKIEEMNGWPLRSGHVWNETNFDYYFTLTFLFTFYIAPRITNSSVPSFQLEEKNPPLDRSYLNEGFSNEVVQAYYKYMIDVAVALGIDESAAKRELEETLRLEIELVQIVFTRANNYDWHNRFSNATLEELESKYPNMPWTKFAPGFKTVGLQIRADWETMDKVNKWLSEKSKRSLANWEAWRFLAARVPYFGRYFARKTKVLREFTDGISEEIMSDLCLQDTRFRLGFAFGALYQRKYISSSAINDLITILDNMKEQFSEFIQKADWLDVDTKINAVEKVSQMRSSLVVCKDLISDDELETFYQDLELTDGSMSDTFKNVTKFIKKNAYFTHYLGRTSRMRCGEFLLETQYKFQLNFIQVGAEMYTDFFYDVDQPKYLNYGITAENIGHEIGHSFDIDGRYFDINGNLKLWSNSESNQKFINRTECLIRQYENYVDHRLRIHVDGISTQNENLADNVGVKIAYHTYTKWAKANGREKRLPGLDYSPNQMFWIGMANSICERYRPEFLRKMFYEDVHSPSKFRVNGPVSNMQEFSDDFGCELGTKMNPVNKCNLW